VTTSHVLLGVGLIFVLAVGSQVLASRLHVPPIFVLLPAGFLAGMATSYVNLHGLLGSAYHPLIALAVAVLLYYSGLNVDLHYLSGPTRRSVFWLVGLGVPVTAALTAVAAAPLLSISAGAAVVLGAVLVLSGPAVVGPLLAMVRPAERLGRVLTWESNLVIPVGALLAVIVFQGVLASHGGGVADWVGDAAASVGIGVAAGVIGTVLLWLALQKLALVQTLGTSSQLAVVIVVTGACDVLRSGTGIIAAVVMGLALANLPGFDIPARLPFLEMPIQLTIDVLLVSVAATVTPHELGPLVLPTLAIVGVMMLIARPAVALLATRPAAGLTRRERLFTGCVAPRGVTAAALAATMGFQLARAGVGGAARILPVTLLAILLTIVFYGLAAAPAARLLGVLRSPRTRPLLVGGDAWVIDLGRTLQLAGLDVLMWAGLERQREQISQAALQLAPGELLASVTADRADPSGINTVLLLTGEDDFNALAASVLRYSVGDRVFRLGPPVGGRGVVAPFTGGDVLFGHALNRSTLATRYEEGARIVALRADCDPPASALPAGDDLLFLVRPDGRLDPATRRRTPTPRAGDTVVALRSAS
jgi:NhaP-type Na+/H+ or K+/H+ antiporter